MRNIYEEGFLSDLCSNILAGEKVKKLTDNEFAQVIPMYGTLEYAFDIRKISSNTVYQASNGKNYKGADLKAITALMYHKPRSAYWISSKPHIYDSSLCAAVPIPMLAFKRYRNIAYSKHMLDTKMDVEKLWLLDQLLGKALASTSIKDGKIVLNPEMGLGSLCSTPIVGWTSKVVRMLREKGFGKRKGSYASTFGASEVNIHEGLNVQEVLFVDIYNMSNNAIKHMLTQRWVWYGNHRNSDMICDPRDWDNIPTSIDTTSSAFVGIDPLIHDKRTIMDFYD